MINIQLIDPRHVSPQIWCDQMVLELDRFGTIPIIGIGVDWRDWANQVVQLSEISIFDPPDPNLYKKDDFEGWAIDFNDSLSGEQ